MSVSLLYGNWVDLVIIVFILLSVFEARKRGLIVGFLDFFGFLLSFIVALRYYLLISYIFAESFSFSKGISDAIGFFATAFLAEMVFAYILSYVASFIPMSILKSKANRVLSIVPPILTSLVTVSFIVTIALSLPIRGSLKKAIADSKIGGFLISKTHVVEKQLSAIFNQASLDTLNFLTISPDPISGESVDLNFTVENYKVDKKAESAMFALINTERAANGLSLLEKNVQLRDLARLHAQDMFEKGYFSHIDMQGRSPFDRMDEIGISYHAAGENLALAPTVQIAHKGLMDSPGHRANILSSEFRKVGVGVIDGGIYGKMFVQEFTD